MMPEKGNLVLVLDRSEDRPHFFLEANPCFMWHSLNAYEEGGKIIADFVGYEKPDHFMGPDAPVSEVMMGRKGSYTGFGVLRRYVIDPEKRKMEQQVLLDDNHEWPVVNPLLRCYKNRYGYLARAKKDEFFWSGITRIDTLTGKTWQHDFGSGQYCGEPLFVPKPGVVYSPDAQEPGWIMTEVYDNKERKSFLAIFDAERISDGPLVKILLKHHIPYSIHGFWQEA